jgi:hypothetical protein
MKNIKAKELKKGAINSKNGWTVYYAGGYVYSKLYFSVKFKTLKELKEFMKIDLR